MIAGVACGALVASRASGSHTVAEAATPARCADEIKKASTAFCGISAMKDRKTRVSVDRLVVRT